MEQDTAPPRCQKAAPRLQPAPLPPPGARESPRMMSKGVIPVCARSVEASHLLHASKERGSLKQLPARCVLRGASASASEAQGKARQPGQACGWRVCGTMSWQSSCQRSGPAWAALRAVGRAGASTFPPPPPGPRELTALVTGVSCRAAAMAWRLAPELIFAQQEASCAWRKVAAAGGRRGCKSSRRPRENCGSL